MRGDRYCAGTAAKPVTAAPTVVAAQRWSLAAPRRGLAADELVTLMTRAKGLLAAGILRPPDCCLQRAREAKSQVAALCWRRPRSRGCLGRQISQHPLPIRRRRALGTRGAQLGAADDPAAPAVNCTT